MGTVSLLSPGEVTKPTSCTHPEQNLLVWGAAENMAQGRWLPAGRVAPGLPAAGSCGPCSRHQDGKARPARFVGPSVPVGVIGPAVPVRVVGPAVPVEAVGPAVPVGVVGPAVPVAGPG